jgi:exonuclease III
MSLLEWNSRGGAPATVQELVTFVQTYKPSLVFLCETRQSEERVKNLRLRIGMKNCFHVKGEGSRGGIALYSLHG